LGESRRADGVTKEEFEQSASDALSDALNSSEGYKNS